MIEVITIVGSSLQRVSGLSCGISLLICIQMGRPLEDHVLNELYSNIPLSACISPSGGVVNSSKMRSFPESVYLKITRIHSLTSLLI